MQIAIIGAGFSGVATAYQLLRASSAGKLPSGSTVTIYNSSGPAARGLAYGTRSNSHLLNVPAARMSLDPDQPSHFLDWLHRQGLKAQAQDFVGRRLYGDYLQASLQTAIQDGLESQSPSSSMRVNLVVAQVVRCTPAEPPTEGWQLEVQSQEDASRVEQHRADRVILALGHFAPRPPHPALAGLPISLYANDPWAADALEGLSGDEPVLLVGTGLTMLDVALSLQQRGHRGRVLALSRRGLLPQSHRANELPPPSWAVSGALYEPRGNLATLLKQFRAELKMAATKGQDWRDVWGAIRSFTPHIWAQLSARDKAQFLRHLQPYWDVHRHRAAPAAIQAWQGLCDTGQLTAAAGRIEQIETLNEGAGLRVQWRARAGHSSQNFEAARVINCSGPSAAIQRSNSELLWQMRCDGLLSPCPLGLGLHVDSGHHILDAQLRSQRGLFYIGPLLKSRYWEATAVPELRQHAKSLVETLTSELTSSELG